MGPEEQPLRLFVAVDLPRRVRDAVGRLQGDLRALGLRDLRWVRPEGIHLTLKFLGDTPAERVPLIEESLGAAVRASAPFRLALGSPGTFGHTRAPRVLWVDVSGDVARLRELQAGVERQLVEAGFAEEEREFSPHLTLARIRQPPSPGTAERVARALEAVSPPNAGFEVEEVVLMRSTLRPEGAVYGRLSAFALS